mmetsp:Transcript_13025/g.43333  ORF Transcript_13025/g.43333 Transcript_13025/m.43333 type:complete len:294 (-) Transcript_13025:115-996(-)
MHACTPCRAHKRACRGSRKSFSPSAKQAGGDSRLPDRAIAGEEDADRGRPVESARARALQETHRAALRVDLLGHPDETDGEGARLLVARLVDARALREDTDRDHVGRRGEESADRAARRSKERLGEEGVHVDDNVGRVDDVRLEPLKDGELDRAEGHIPPQRRAPRAHHVLAPRRCAEHAAHRVGRRRVCARLQPRLDRLGGRADHRPDRLPRGASEEVRDERVGADCGCGEQRSLGSLVHAEVDTRRGALLEERAAKAGVQVGEALQTPRASVGGGAAREGGPRQRLRAGTP